MSKRNFHFETKGVHVLLWNCQDDNICKFIHKKCHYKIYHSDVKYFMTLNTIFSAVLLCGGTLMVVVVSKKISYLLHNNIFVDFSLTHDVVHGTHMAVAKTIYRAPQIEHAKTNGPPKLIHQKSCTLKNMGRSIMHVEVYCILFGRWTVKPLAMWNSNKTCFGALESLVNRSHEAFSYFYFSNSLLLTVLNDVFSTIDLVALSNCWFIVIVVVQ